MMDQQPVRDVARLPCILKQGSIMSIPRRRRASRSEHSERSEARRPAASSSPLRPSRPRVSKNPAGRIPRARTVARAAAGGKPAFARKGTGMTAQFVGIDVSKAALDVYRLSGEDSSRFENSPEGRRQLIEWLAGKPIERIVLEASGGYERWLVSELMMAGMPVVVVNPRQVQELCQSDRQAGQNRSH